ncbi:MAG: TRAP transporter small permease [Hyphomicrobiales bacterium]|nr:TRAP transporter small permease [Hyphomicrobiales bacterium]
MNAQPPRGLAASLARFGRRLADIGLGIGAVALLTIVVLNALNIALRYFFRSPLPWAEEAMLYLMILGVYIGAISVAWQQAHIRTDAILDFAPPRRRRVLEIISTLVMVAVLVPVVFASYRVTSLLLEIEQRSDALHLPIWIPQAVVPISLLLIVALALMRLLVKPGVGAPTTGPSGG